MVVPPGQNERMLFSLYGMSFTEAVCGEGRTEIGMKNYLDLFGPHRMTARSASSHGVLRRLRLGALFVCAKPQSDAVQGGRALREGATLRAPNRMWIRGSDATPQADLARRRVTLR
jgi:hypothetical protein